MHFGSHILHLSMLSNIYNFCSHNKTTNSGTIACYHPRAVLHHRCRWFARKTLIFSDVAGTYTLNLKMYDYPFRSVIALLLRITRLEWLAERIVERCIKIWVFTISSKLPFTTATWCELTLVSAFLVPEDVFRETSAYAHVLDVLGGVSGFILGVAAYFIHWGFWYDVLFEPLWRITEKRIQGVWQLWPIGEQPPGVA